jgi:hypothetical protein
LKDVPIVLVVEDEERLQEIVHDALRDGLASPGARLYLGFATSNPLQPLISHLWQSTFLYRVIDALALLSVF